MELKYFLMLLSYISIILLAKICTIEATTIVPLTSSPTYARPTESVTLKWKYTLADSDVLGHLGCGYRETTSSNATKALVMKRGTAAGTVEADPSQFPAELTGRVAVYEKGFEFGMTINNVNTQDQKLFLCSLQYYRSGVPQVPLFSSGVQLIVRVSTTIVPLTSSPTYARRTESVTLKWKYTLADGDVLGLLRCGYGDTTSLNVTKTLVVKRGTAAGAVEADPSQFPAEFTGRVAVYEKDFEFGMTISNVNTQDQKLFLCSLQYYRLGVPQVPILSSGVPLILRDVAGITSLLSSPVYAKLSQSVTFKWRYILPAGDHLHFLSCGYLVRLSPLTTKMKILVRKNRYSSVTIDKDPHFFTFFPSEYKGRVIVFDEGLVFGMTIQNLTKSDQNDFFCSLWSRRFGGVRRPQYSESVKLLIQDQPGRD